MNKANIPVIALKGMTVLPGMVIHFDISREKSKRAAEYCMKSDQKVFLVAQKEIKTENPGADDLYKVGTLVHLRQVVKMPNGMMRALAEGLQKGTILNLVEDGPMLQADVYLTEESAEHPDMLSSRAMVRELHDLIKQYAALNPQMSRDQVRQWLETEDFVELLRGLLADFPMDYQNRQHFLEMDNLEEEFITFSRMLIQEINISRIRMDIAEKVHQNVEQSQKEYVLREQRKVIDEELNGEDGESEADEFLAQVEKLEAPAQIKEKLRKEIHRYENFAQASPEASVSRGYIETLLELPWDKMSEDNKDIDNAKAVLDEDHYGLEKVKERVLEALAVRNITHAGEAPIICLVGPPGTGKTSIAKSVARALNRQYIRICLGGVRDEAEIRGHRRTYVGAMPGRIITGLKEAGVKNPLMLLDEIDKISSDYKGDTASALLEVLDGEQNSHFVDHYVELPTDLSEVLFIATANDLSGMSRPLLDRMEIIELNSYTMNEKLHIAKEHLIPKQIEKNGLARKQVRFTDKALKSIIQGYTMEAGVRGLERCIAAVCRKAVRELYENGQIRSDKIQVNQKNLVHYLGKVKFMPAVYGRHHEIGLVRGLAWTSVGGELLEIEVSTMPGKGTLCLTGQMGDVMQESAQIALSYVRSAATKLDSDYFEKNTIHLHIPEGAVPKDGPSAGVTMATAIYSAVMQIPARADLAMTGEITLRGRVLPIGGLKEKILAANVAGMKEVLVPERNKPDIEELSEEIIGNLQISYVSDVKQVFEKALVRR